MRAQLREKDTARQRRLYQNKTPVTILHTAESENRLMRRLTQGQSVMAAPRMQGRSSPPAKQLYTFSSDRQERAINDLETAFKGLKATSTSISSGNKEQEAMLREFAQIVQRSRLSPDDSMNIFCQAFCRVFQFSSESVTLKFPRVFVSMFQSRKSKKTLLRHVQSLIGSGTGGDWNARSVRALLCGLVLVEAIDLQDIEDWGKAKDSTDRHSGAKLGTLAYERSHLFRTMCGSTPSKTLIRLACSKWVLSRLIEHFYEHLTETHLSEAHQKKLFSEIYAVASLGSRSGVTDSKDGPQIAKMRAASIFADAWVASYLTKGSPCFIGTRAAKLKSAIEKFDSVFATLFKDQASLQELLLNRVLLAFCSSGGGDYAVHDPLVGVLKGLYNAFALRGSTIIDWHFGIEGSNKFALDVEQMLKARSKIFVDWLWQQGERQSEKAAKMSKKVKNKKTRKEGKRKDKRIADIKAGYIVSSQIDIPKSMLRAPNEIARDLRMGRKNWNSSGTVAGSKRPETPMFAKWSPIEASRLTDRSVPSFPSAICTIVHTHRPPKSTQHVDSEKQQILHGHYSDPHPPQRRKKVVNSITSRPGRIVKLQANKTENIS